MIDVIEDIRNEFKVKLTDNFEKEIIAFLNTTKRTIQRNIKELIDKEILSRIGSNRQGRWNIKS